MEQDTKFTVPGRPRIRLDVMLAAKQNSDWHGRPQMNRWLEYDVVALTALVFGIAAVELLAISL